MANLSTFYQTYDNSGNGVAASYLDANKGVTEGQGIAGRTRVLKLAKSSISQAEIESVILALQTGGTKGTDDACVVVGFVDTHADYVHVAVQGTGPLTAGADYRGVTGVTMSVEADFAGLQA